MSFSAKYFQQSEVNGTLLSYFYTYIWNLFRLLQNILPVLSFFVKANSHFNFEKILSYNAFHVENTALVYLCDVFKATQIIFQKYFIMIIPWKMSSWNMDSSIRIGLVDPLLNLVNTQYKHTQNYREKLDIRYGWG